MTSATHSAERPLGLDPSARMALAARIGASIERARHEGTPALASVTVPAPAELDLAAAIIAARLPGERAFCFEQPDRDRAALAALGEAALVEARGEERFANVVSACRRLSRTALAGAVSDDGAPPPGSGPVWVGGFAFAHDGGLAPEWSSLSPAQLVLPEVSLARSGGETRLTLNAVVGAEDERDTVLARLEARADSLRPASMPLLDPHPAGAPRVASATPPQHFEAAVERAVERIGQGEIEKIVLAREVRVHAPAPFDEAAIYAALRDNFPSCYCYLVATAEAAFVGASPELLVRREGQRVQTVALAGTRRRSADPAVDSHLGEQLLHSSKDREEQAIVTRRIEHTLAPVSVWVAAAEQPVIVKVLNVQHLATPIRAQLQDALSCVELVGLLHPTPAVGGEPRGEALRLIPALEGLDRGWYAGALGWMDLAEDGEFCVALRCALLRDSVAHLYAGEGIVRESVGSEELAANEAKLEALLPLLT